VECSFQLGQACARAMPGPKPDRAGRIQTVLLRLFPTGDDRSDEGKENGAVEGDRNIEEGNMGGKSMVEAGPKEYEAKRCCEASKIEGHLEESGVMLQGKIKIKKGK